MKFVRITVLAVLTVLAASCAFGPVIQGSGDIVSEPRYVDSFHSVVLEGSGLLRTSSSTVPEVTIRVDDNILPYITTTVRNGVLTVSVESGISLGRHSLTVDVGMPETAVLELRGSGDIRSLDPLTGQNISLVIQGSGEAEAEVSAVSLTARIEGSGRITATGSADRTVAVINGSGTVDLLSVPCRTSRAEIEGSGNLYVRPSDRLDWWIEGSGTIHYVGYPVTSGSVSGSGGLHRL